MTRQLRDMIVVITGASAGIGKALAENLSARGAKLVLAARRGEILNEINQRLGGGHLVVPADVSRPEDCERIITRAVERFGRIDTLVCNAGYGLYRLAWKFSPDDIRKMFATNFFGTTDLIHFAVPRMLAQEFRDGRRGQIMIVSSAAAGRGVPYLGPYSATKAAQKSLAEALRAELGPQRIAVTSVHPIMTETDFGAAAEQFSDVKLPRISGPTQSVDHVVKKMIRAIEKPRPEVWPHQPTRIALVFAAMFPRLADKIMAKYFRDVKNANKDGSSTDERG